MPETPERDRERTVILEDKTLARLHGGFTQVPNFLLRRKDLSPGAKITYSLLLSYAWQDDFCFPAQERIAEDSGYSERQVRRTLVELRDKGLIDWKQRGLNRPNVYRLLPVFKTPSGAIVRPGPDTMSAPDRTRASAQDRTPMSAYKDPMKKIQNVNVGTRLLKETDATEEADGRTQALVLDILDVCRDPHSTGSYLQLARTYPESLIREALSLTKDGATRGLIRKSRGAYFTDMLRRLAAERGFGSRALRRAA